jgi:phenylpropionate dioxygenase-like ring-hydroxylating dioxygenase large terminal subunit
MDKNVAKPLGPVPFAVTNPERIPVKRYYDEAFYKLECEHLWPHVWQMACRLEEIPKVGDWVEYKNLGKSVLVVRTKAGIKAFHNACRHRGVQLATGHGNCEKRGFVCPFHGWRFNMDGDCTFVFGRHIFSEENLEKGDLALVPCRVETWGGSAFINWDNNAPSLMECLGPVAKRMDARNVDKLKIDTWHATILPTNWKTAMEAFMEGYHAMATHPQLHELASPGVNPFGSDSGGGVEPANPKTSKEWVDFMVSMITKLHSGMGGMVDDRELAVAQELQKNMELPEDMGAAAMAFFGRMNQEVTDRGRAAGVPVFDMNQVAATHEFHGVEFLFPHYFLLPFMSAMSSYRIRPLGPESCLFEIFSLSLHPEGETSEPPVFPALTPHDDPGYPEIPRQDYSNLPLQQVGLHAQGFEYMRLSKEKEGMISNYHRLIDGYLSGMDPARLAKASQIVNSGFEGPILDIGL